jgi:hypothetical protein
MKGGEVKGGGMKGREVKGGGMNEVKGSDPRISLPPTLLSFEALTKTLMQLSNRKLIRSTNTQPTLAISILRHTLGKSAHRIMQRRR